MEKHRHFSKKTLLITTSLLLSMMLPGISSAQQTEHPIAASEKKHAKMKVESALIITSDQDGEDIQEEKIKITHGGLEGKAKLRDLDDHRYVRKGTIEVNKDSKLTITEIKGDQVNFNFVNLLKNAGLSTQQELCAGKSHSLVLFDYLGILDPQNDGVKLSTLRDLFGQTMTVKGTLTDGSGEVSQVSIEIDLKKK